MIPVFVGYLLNAEFMQVTVCNIERNVWIFNTSYLLRLRQESFSLEKDVCKAK